MRRIFYLSLFLFSQSFVFAQNPGGIPGSVLWLRGDAGYSTGNPGITPAQWDDFSGLGNNFTQSDPDKVPTYNSNIFNFNSALTFDGTYWLSLLNPTSFPAGDQDRTIFVVANAASVSGFQWIIAYGTRSPQQTNQVGSINGSLANAFYFLEMQYGNYWDATPNLTGAMTTFTLQSSLGNQYDRGNYLQSQSLGGLGATSTDAVIGALSNTGGETWNGNIGEIIIYPTALTDADRGLVESYLALKYGFTLGNTGNILDYIASDGTTKFWTGSTTYQNDVFGIGTDLGSSLVVLNSNSMNTGAGDGAGQPGKANITIGVGIDPLDKQFLMIGNDGGSLAEQTIGAGEAPAIAVGSTRLGRNWKVQNTNNVGPLDVFTFDVNGLTLAGGNVADNFRLMIDPDGDEDYSTGSPEFLKPVGSNGSVLFFDAVNLPDGATFAMITQGSAALLPAAWQGFDVSLLRSKATLTWKTSDEVNVDHYTAEYSVNGVSYSTLASVKAKNAAGVNVYTISQDNLPAGIRYYRIKRVDKDGKSELSPVRSVRAGGIASVLLRTNPITRGSVDLVIDIPQYQEAVIRIFSLEGRILSMRNTSLSTGTNNISTNVSKLAAGTYIVQVQMGKEVYTKKFVKQ